MCFEESALEGLCLRQRWQYPLVPRNFSGFRRMVGECLDIILGNGSQSNVSVGAGMSTTFWLRPSVIASDASSNSFRGSIPSSFLKLPLALRPIREFQSRRVVGLGNLGEGAEYVLSPKEF